MSAKQWLIFIVSFLVIMLMFSFLDFILAGIFYLIVLLFDEANVAASVFKWVFVIPLFIEMAILFPYLYESTKNGKDEI